MIHKRWGHIGLLWSFIPNFHMEALGVNATKSLFSSNLTKEVEIEDPKGQEDSDLDLDPEEDIRIIMQQCLQPHPIHFGCEPNGTKNIFKLKILTKNK
jgi:hypothetical protein